MSKYDKKLKKALAQYENGNYEEALDICEKILDKPAAEYRFSI